MNDHIATILASLGDDITGAADFSSVGNQKDSASAYFCARRSYDALVVDRQPVDITAVCDQFGLGSGNESCVDDSRSAQRLGCRSDNKRRKV